MPLVSPDVACRGFIAGKGPAHSLDHLDCGLRCVIWETGDSVLSLDRRSKVSGQNTPCFSTKHLSGSPFGRRLEAPFFNLYAPIFYSFQLRSRFDRRCLHAAEEHSHQIMVVILDP